MKQDRSLTFLISKGVPVVRIKPTIRYHIFMKKWNHYTCPICKGVTIARHDNEGITPITLRCRAKDKIHGSGIRIPVCKGQAESNFFSGFQYDSQIPHIIFHRPEPLQAIEDISKEPIACHAELLDHYKNGGSLEKR